MGLVKTVDIVSVLTIFSMSCVYVSMDTEEDAVSVHTPEVLCYKQRLEKSTGPEICLMKWSPVADLLAASCSDHSVSLLTMILLTELNLTPFARCCSQDADDCVFDIRWSSTVSPGNVCGALHLLSRQFQP